MIQNILISIFQSILRITISASLISRLKTYIKIKANKIHTFFQPKRKKRGRPAKNAKNVDEESENSQNMPPASAENSKSLPPAPADETSVVNDNKIQVFFSSSN